MTKSEKPAADKKARACFVIAPIGAEGSHERSRSDKVLRHVIQPACELAGIDKDAVRRADHIMEVGPITTQVINAVLEADLVVADLTGRNPNVFYELAIRHAARRPYIQIIQKGELLPFDVADIRTVQLDITDPDSVVEARAAVAKMASAMLQEGAEILSPVSTAIDLGRMATSSDLMQMAIAEVANDVREIRGLLQADRDVAAQRRRMFGLGTLSNPYAMSEGGLTVSGSVAGPALPADAIVDTISPKALEKLGDRLEIAIKRKKGV